MLRFASRPNQIFTRLLNDSLDMAMDHIDKDEIDVHWLDSSTFKLFGSSVDIIINELKKLRAAHISPELFMPTDLHFRLLDRIIEWFCIIYNDMTETQDMVTGDGDLICKFNVDEIRSTFFWDCDYDFMAIDPVSEQASRLLQTMGVSPSAINIQKRNPADIIDLTLIKMEEDPDWSEPENFFETKSPCPPGSNLSQDEHIGENPDGNEDLFF